MGICRKREIGLMDAYGETCAVTQGIDGYDVIKVTVRQKNIFQGCPRILNSIQNGIRIGAGIDDCRMRTGQ